MSNNLSKIREMITGVKNSLASLKVDPSKLDDLDSVTSQRVMLREKLETLEAAEAEERERLAEEEKKNNGKRRRAALVELAATTEKLIAEHASLTEQAKCLISDLVKVLVKRECVFTRDNTGLNDPVFSELFSSEEHRNLLHEMDRSAIGVYPGEFGATVYREIDKHASDDNMKRINREIRALVHTPNTHHTPIEHARTFLVDLARSMQASTFPEPVKETDATVKEEKPGNHQEVDLRPSAKQKKQKKYNPFTGLVETV